MKFDNAYIGILISNVLVLLFGLGSKWSNFEFLLVYWSESMIIGFFTLLKLYFCNTAKDSVKLLFGIFFCIHFGGFLMGHLILLIILPIFSIINSESFIIAPQFNIEQLVNGFFTFVLSFTILFFSHLYSFYINFYTGKNRKSVTPEKLFLLPYPRVFFMQFALLALFSAPAVALISVKIIADMLGHLVEHVVIMIKS
jgi:hypothetical protein